MRLPAALLLVAAASGLAVSPAAAELSKKAPRASLVQVLRGGRQALVLDRVSGEYEVVKVGDSIHGLRVAEIEEDQIVLATPSPPERYFVLPLVEAAPPGKVAGGGPAGGGADAVPPVPADPRVDDGVPGSEPGANAGANDREAGAEQPGSGPAEDGADPGDAPEPGDAPDESDVLDPYGTRGDVGGGPAIEDPYGGSRAGDFPSVVAPPGSRAEPGAPDGARSPDAPPRAPGPPAADARPDRERDRDPELDGDSRSGAGEEDDLGEERFDADLPEPDAEPVAPESPESARSPKSPDSNVTTVKPTEVQPGASSPPDARSKDEKVKSLSRRELDWALSDFAALSKQIRIERAADGGVRIVELKKGSFVERLGLERGDVVLRVAGHSIDNVDKAADAYAALASARDVTVEIERKGAPLRLRYRLTR